MSANEQVTAPVATLPYRTGDCRTGGRTGAGILQKRLSQQVSDMINHAGLAPFVDADCGMTTVRSGSTWPTRRSWPAVMPGDPDDSKTCRPDLLGHFYDLLGSRPEVLAALYRRLSKSRAASRESWQDESVDPVEFRRQVMRRLRYGLNVVALERDLVPPEGPFDVALTNGLAAIVSLEHPGAEKDQRGRMLPASGLLKILEDRDEALDFPALREVLDITQPLRHGRADDEYLLPVQQHLRALVDLDGHRALLVLDQARAAGKIADLVALLYADAASEITGLDFMSPKERLDQPNFEECDECWRNTFLPDGHDEFGGTNSTGRCVACGYERDEDTARDLAIGAEFDRVMDKD